MRRDKQGEAIAVSLASVRVESRPCNSCALSSMPLFLLPMQAWSKRFNITSVSAAGKNDKVMREIAKKFPVRLWIFNYRRVQFRILNFSRER